ncbi:glycosyltransferase [Pseudoalteromonas piscicida]|uniref:Glycosyl transferase family 1 domain-containing protein n=1 Tax=Pseudoalteromonas piscicida TaxID=43662 RepID=A0A2A5JW80_PSEO7|nr:glycosyltransferase [Pseudoalteromonas piscicida]PCK33606.1 hypothetical protein CEX98_00890 [Pseudoalteromonas piscicida]
MDSKYIHLVPSLKTGGAEWMLFKLTSQSPCKHVIYYFEDGPVANKLLDAGVEFVKIDGPLDFLRVVRKEKSGRVVMAWLYKACLIAAFVKLLIPNTKVIFNHRNSLGSDNTQKFLRKVTLLLLKLASKFVDGVIFNSNRGKETYSLYGIKAKNEIVIQNGFDLELFRPLFDSKLVLREKYNIQRDKVIYIVSARNSPEKQLGLIIDSFLEFSESHKNALLLICGRETEKLSQEYHSENLMIIGEVSDVSQFYQMSDFGILYSVTEGFPNVVGEAMACGLPCIVSDVGDCSELAMGSGWVCDATSREDLKVALSESISLSHEDYVLRSGKAVEVIKGNYSISAVCDRFMQFMKG